MQFRSARYSGFKFSLAIWLLFCSLVEFPLLLLNSTVRASHVDSVFNNLKQSSNVHSPLALQDQTDDQFDSGPVDSTDSTYNSLSGSVPTKTIMDILSSSTDFSELVNLLQHHGLVPLINRSWNSTFLAPVNSAFVGIDKAQITAEQLLYHFINGTVWRDDIAYGTRVYRTYLDEGQAPISLSLSNGVNNAVEFKELDLVGSPQRGLVHSLSKLLDIPQSLNRSLLVDPQSSLFASLVDEDIPLKGCTIFAPNSQALKSGLISRADLNSSKPLVDYLHSTFGKHDRKLVVERHIHRGILDQFNAPQQVNMLDGSNTTIYEDLKIVLTDGVNFTVNMAPCVNVARDGLYIMLDDLLTPSDVQLFDVTAEKLILGIGGYNLVRALILYGHYDLINSTDSGTKSKAIVVPTGLTDMTVVSQQHSLEPHEVSRRSNLKELTTISDPSSVVLYQFLDSSLPKQADIQLIDSLMTLRSRRYPQRIHFERRKTGSLTLNWEVLGEQVYKWGNLTFYSSEELLAPPSSLTMALGPLLMSSYSLSYLDKLNRLQLPRAKSWTLFVPTRDAWEKNMLLKDYLDKNDNVLSRIFDNLIFQTPFYSDSNETKTKQFSGHETIVRWDPDFKEFYLSNDMIKCFVGTEVTDVLFDNGVAHIVNDVPLPYDLEITTSDLIISGQRKLFIDLLEAAGMSEVLAPSANYTILVPPPRDLHKHNYTVDTDRRKLQNMLKLHLLPGNPLGNLFRGDSATTLAGEQLEVHAIGPSQKVYALSPVSATNEQEVLIFEYGFTNGQTSGGSSVVFINRHISPAWIIPIKFGLRKGTYALLGVLLGLVGAISFIFGLFWFISRPKDGFEDLTDEEHEGYRDDVGSEEESRLLQDGSESVSGAQ